MMILKKEKWRQMKMFRVLFNGLYFELMFDLHSCV